MAANLDLRVLVLESDGHVFHPLGEWWLGNVMPDCTDADRAQLLAGRDLLVGGGAAQLFRITLLKGAGDRGIDA